MAVKSEAEEKIILMVVACAVVVVEVLRKSICLLEEIKILPLLSSSNISSSQ